MWMLGVQEFKLVTSESDFFEVPDLVLSLLIRPIQSESADSKGIGWEGADGSLRQSMGMEFLRPVMPISLPHKSRR